LFDWPLRVEQDQLAVIDRRQVGRAVNLLAAALVDRGDIGRPALADDLLGPIENRYLVGRAVIIDVQAISGMQNDGARVVRGGVL
jgi:hypothetical protein